MALVHQDADTDQILRQAPNLNAVFLNNQPLMLEAFARINQHGKRFLEWLKQPRKSSSLIPSRKQH